MQNRRDLRILLCFYLLCIERRLPLVLPTIFRITNHLPPHDIQQIDQNVDLFVRRIPPDKQDDRSDTRVPRVAESELAEVRSRLEEREDVFLSCSGWRGAKDALRQR